MATKKTTQPIYKVAPVWLAVFYGVLLLVFVGFLQRKGVFWADVPGEIGLHLSNFAISYLIVAGPGLMNLVLGAPFLAVWLIAGGMVFANLLAEFALTVINTKDPLDAVYGIAGTLLAVGLLLLIKCYGLVKIPAKSPKK
ncbi:MAG: hypothetical protein WBP26_03235 [Candidatus Saccharimonadales bacterium]